MKKKLLLETVLKLKADVERSINATFEDVVKYNFTEKKVESLMTRLDKLEAQLIHFKEVIQEANKSKFEGKTNNYHIYFLSNLVARQRFYENLIKALNRSPKKAETAQIQKEEATSKQQQTGEEITKFQNKLSAFNSKKKVTVYLDESLNLL
jgi:hypothetical protein